MAREEARLRMTLFVAVVIAFVVLMVGVTTDYWGQSRRTSAIHYGLWKSCGSIGVSDQSPIRCFSPEDKRVSGKFIIQEKITISFVSIECMLFVVEETCKYSQCHKPTTIQTNTFTEVYGKKVCGY